jgi:hypothetical protein
MEDIMDGTEGISTYFKNFRDDKSKVSKVRTAFKNNMWLIQNIVHAVQNVGNAASVCLNMTALGIVYGILISYRPFRRLCQLV